ncbi:signal recognition particle receptor alpha subunit family protein [Euphorbia peplus]|nr:signal recognition particle receptor alpha subunit family protein [Euphorbia peplus]
MSNSIIWKNFLAVSTVQPSKDPFCNTCIRLGYISNAASTPTDVKSLNQKIDEPIQKHINILTATHTSGEDNSANLITFVLLVIKTLAEVEKCIEPYLSVRNLPTPSTRYGIICWFSYETNSNIGNVLRGSPIDTLIRSCLLEERSGAASYNYDASGASYTLKWTFHNDLGLLFVVVYQRILHLLYVDELLGLMKREFSEIYDPKRTDYNDFDESFSQLRKEAEARAEELKKSKQLSKPVNDGSKVEPKKKITKKNRVWDDTPKETKLDFTDPVEENGNQVDVLATDHGESMMEKEEIVSSDIESEDEEVGKDNKPDTKKKGCFSSMFNRKANLEKLDLEPALKALKDRLMTKNVICCYPMLYRDGAKEMAEKLCESVAASLEGKKLPSFTRISSTVQAAMEDALLRILTHRRSIDILRDVHAAKEQRKPYVVVFVGVNGVGKSTNLAKVAY